MDMGRSAGIFFDARCPFFESLGISCAVFTYESEYFFCDKWIEFYFMLIYSFK